MARVSTTLTTQQLNNVLRAVRNGDSNRITSVLASTSAALSRLSASGSMSRQQAMGASIPTGSDQIDLGSFATWCKNIAAGNATAINQLRQIHATAKYRNQ